MKQIIEIADDYIQQLTIALENNETFNIQLNYDEQYKVWYIMNLTYKTVVLSAMRVCVNDNLLRQWKNLLPFGIRIEIVDFSEPYLLDDFLTQRVKFILLNSSEINY